MLISLARYYIKLSLRDLQKSLATVGIKVHAPAIRKSTNLTHVAGILKKVCSVHSLETSLPVDIKVRTGLSGIMCSGQTSQMATTAVCLLQNKDSLVIKCNHCSNKSTKTWLKKGPNLNLIKKN